MPKVKLDSTFCLTATCEEGEKRTRYYDTTVTGFVFEVHASGSKTYVLRYTNQYGVKTERKINTNELLLNQALTKYKDALLFETGKQLTPQQDHELMGQISQLGQRAATAVGQRSAFQCVLATLREMTGLDVKPDDDAELRDKARLSTGLPLFPASTNNLTTVITHSPALPNASLPRLLDVEVIAIYW